MTEKPTFKPVNSLIKALHRSKNLVLEGVPGTGKTHMVQEIAKQWKNVIGNAPKSLLLSS